MQFIKAIKGQFKDKKAVLLEEPFYNTGKYIYMVQQYNPLNDEWKYVANLGHDKDYALKVCSQYGVH